MKIASKANDGVVMVEKYLLIFMYSLMIILGLMQVLLRFVFRAPLPWSEGLLTYLFIWSSFVGAAFGMNKMEHFYIEAIVDLFPKGLQRVIDIFIYLLLIALSVFMVYRGTILALQQQMVLMPTIRATMMWPYLSLPFSFLLIGLHSIANLICSFKKDEVEP